MKVGFFLFPAMSEDECWCGASSWSYALLFDPYILKFYSLGQSKLRWAAKPKYLTQEDERWCGASSSYTLLFKTYSSSIHSLPVQAQMGRRAKYLTQEAKKCAARERKAQDLRTAVYVIFQSSNYETDKF